jgi:hypothetical protein
MKREDHRQIRDDVEREEPDVESAPVIAFSRRQSWSDTSSIIRRDHPFGIG